MINIAIDGPSGAGKSTVAKMLAKKHNMIYLDTGAMYRAVGLKVKRTGIDLYYGTEFKDLLSRIILDIKYIDGEQHIYLDSIDVSKEIREPDISKYASDVSAVPACRFRLVDWQREIASKNNCVIDGRDIGTYVLPNADLKIFLTAKPEVRAERRYKELVARGKTVDLKTILADMIERDTQDSTRALAPLRKAIDAVEIDSSDMTAEEVVAKIDRMLKRDKII